MICVRAEAKNSSLLRSSESSEGLSLGDQMSVSSSYVYVFAKPAHIKNQTIQEIVNTRQVLLATSDAHHPKMPDIRM